MGKSSGWRKKEKKLKRRMTEYTHHEDWDVRRKKQNWKGRRTDCEEGEKRNDQELERERERDEFQKKKKRIKKMSVVKF